jgi:hypothetical protein
MFVYKHIENSSRKSEIVFEKKMRFKSFINIESAEILIMITSNFEGIDAQNLTGYPNGAGSALNTW